MRRTLQATSSVDPRAAIQGELDRYCRLFPEDKAGLALLYVQLGRHENVRDRRNFTGHVCGSGIVLSPDRTSVLLIHHKLFDCWQQPGGHVEATDLDPAATAIRETQEETGIGTLQRLNVSGEAVPIQVSVHAIPANPVKKEMAHHHFDFRYVFIANDTRLRPLQNEVRDAAWVSFDDPRVDHIGETIRRVRRYVLTEAS